MADQAAKDPQAAGWKKDPTGRHYARYWDGESWTDQVASAEKERSVDPIEAAPVVAPPPPMPVMTSPVQPAPARAPLPPQRLASERVVVQAPMSFVGSAARIWKLTDAGPPAMKAATVPIAVMLVLLAWCVVCCWYLVFGLFLVPYRLLRRGSRKRKRDTLRHQETLRAIERHGR